jgi:two-component system cell cycle sensor histidine kinase/response regulator CckA
MPRTILIVEDSPTQAARIRFLLEDQGYRVEQAANGSEGLGKAQSIRPDLIISDVLMPEMDGFALCQALKSDPTTRTIPFVLLTGQRTPSDIIRGLERGADNFITKPFESQYLLDRVERIFENLVHREKGGAEMQVSVHFGGREVVVNADKQQMIELLFSTSEELSQSNEQLEAARVQLEHQARDLERTMDERTRELRQAEEKYRTLVEQMPAVVYIAAHENVGQTLYISPQIEAVLGFTPAEWMAGAGLWGQKTHPDDRQRIDELFARLRATGAPVSAEYRLLARDGRHVWVRDEARVVQFTGGSPLIVQGVLLDITDRKKVEEALREGEAGFRLLFASNPHPMWVFDQVTLRFLEVNDAALAHYGYSREEFLAMRITDIRPPEDVPALTETLQGGMEAHSRLRLRPWRHRLKDGRVIQVEIATHELDFERRPGVLVVAHDVTARQILEAQLLQAQKMEAIGQLAGGVAHDFNNLLGVITGYSELAQRQIGAAHPARARLDQVIKAAERAAGLTRQLLAFSRKQVMRLKVFDLNAVVADTQKMLGRLIGEDIDVVVHAEPGLGSVRADPGQIEQVLLNLAVNARDAMPKGGTLTLETGNVDLDQAYADAHPPAQAGPYVMLSVSDSGSGMDKATQLRIFEPFFTTKPEGRGTGLGLATVYGIVKQSGGYVWVYSEPGRGTTFKVYLPRVDEPAEAVHPALAVSETPRGGETILLVEDTESLREVIQETLEESGYTVLLASHGEEAVAIARERKGPIDLLLTDVVMPKLGGAELAKRLVVLRPEMRVLYMSGYTSHAISQQGIVGQEVALLQKPFTGDTLARAVREALSRPPPRG